MSVTTLNKEKGAGLFFGINRSDALFARRFPISRWYLMPLVDRLAGAMEGTRVRPIHVTLCGLAIGAMAAAMVVLWPHAAPAAALLVLGAWLCDRLDGALARRQGTASALGAWLDANVDELVELGLHLAVAAAAARLAGSAWPWALLVAFLFGKYLFLYGLRAEGAEGDCPDFRAAKRELPSSCHPSSPWLRRLRSAYHLPGDADVRVHLLVVMLLLGWLTPALAIVAVYYNLRWLVRYGLVARRLGGAR